MNTSINKDDLDAILIDSWERLTSGAKDRRSAFHTPVVASVDHCDVPHQRVMVMRAASSESRQLRFHTDVRTPKVQQIGDGGAISVLGYDAAAKIQIRVLGTGRLETQSEVAEHAWDSSSPSSRRCYLAPIAPSSISATPTSGLPSHVEDRVPSFDETLAGRSHFAVLLVTLNRIEWLYLASNGHRRAAFDWRDDRWHGQWLVP
jgi:pyridoxamine 5'-phosphate oxidase